MIRYILLFVVCLFVQSTFSFVNAQPEFKYGLGAGVSFSNISEINSYPLFEDIAGNEYSSQYSSMFANLGTHFFFHGELWFDKFILALKPGLYTYKFSKTDVILFNTEPIEQTNSYLTRYFQVPLEVKYPFGSGKFKPFIGAGVAYGQLLQQGGSSTQSFIRPKITAAPLAGAYYSFTDVDLVLSVGYNFGLHSITRETDRYNTTSATPYSQSDIKLNDLFVSLSVLFSIGNQESKGALDCPTPNKTMQKKAKRRR